VIKNTSPPLVLLNHPSTAQMIAHHHILTVQEDAKLHGMALGEWEGLAYAEVVRLNEAVHLHGVTAKF
jgi:broad specificity phosphatase PhoE